MKKQDNHLLNTTITSYNSTNTSTQGKGPQQQVLISSSEFISSLNKYIPSLVLQQWITKADSQQLMLPELQPMETVVLFADISGFTNISEACAAMGVRGNEELAFCINRYMEGMVKALGKYGGDIIKFVGDAMIVMWPRIGGTAADDKVTVVRKAIQCALDIQNDMNNKKIMTNVTNLSVKIGIGFGECALLYVGGVFNRAEFFTVGEGLTQALSSEENATAGGQIIVSQNAWSNVSAYFESEELTDEHHGKKFYKISGMIQGIRTRADAVLLRNLIQADNFSRIQGKLRACVPAAIMPYLEIGYEQFGSETRRLTVMFASLGIDLSSAKTKEGMIKIQKIVTTVQQQVYRMEGSLNKLVMDDKGSTLICIWGLCPFSHEDDAARAILTAINIRRELLKIEKTWCNVGISTGEVFSGVVGTSGSRKEFSVLGDYVNLAARIMYYPKKYKQVGKINVDLQTKREADNFINFNYKSHCEFKGKSISLPIFEPIDPAEESLMCIKKIAPFDTFLKIHSNPFIVDRNSEHKRKQVKQIGREQLVSRITEELLDFLEDEGSRRPYILAISGELGSGKTLFARCIIDKLKKRKDILRDPNLDQQLILTSSLNAEAQMKFLNIWRPILQTMLFIVSKRRKASVEHTLQQLMQFRHIKDDRFDVIFDVFGMRQIKPDGEMVELPLPEDPFQFVKREIYAEETVDGILDFIIDFVKIAVGDDNAEDESQMDKSSQGGPMHPFGNIGGHQVLVILDTVYMMDEPSWRLLELIKDECSKVAIIMLVQTDTNNNPKIHPEARQFYLETFAQNASTINVIDLPPFKADDLGQLIADVSSKYQMSMGEEIHLMTYIEDQSTSIKNPEVCRLKERDLRKQFLIQESYFTKVNDKVLSLILQRCEGNPLTSMHFLFNLLSNDFLKQAGVTLEPNAKYSKCVQRSDWTIVPVPGISQKINSALLDSFLKEMRARPNKQDQEFAVKGLLLLKSAAVVGDQFSSRVLQHISPLRHETHSSIMQILKILEAKDLIEILDDRDHKNAVCRFTKCFLRESIYQVMLYRAQKKGIHQLVVQYIQDNPNSIDQDPEIEAEKLLWHILLAEDLDSEDKIPLKSKQGLIVKKIANQLMKNPNAIVKRALLTKEGNKPNRRVEYRLMILKAKSLSWYHDQKEFEAGKKPLGVIYMHAIYHCVPARTLKPTDDLNIGTCAWSKKDIDKEGKREFIFGAENQQQRDEWISCIEYLRTKAIYENFVNKYVNVSFPLKRQDETFDESKEDLIKQTSDFGFKFRSQASRYNKLVNEDYSTLQLQSQRPSSQKRSTNGKSVSPNNFELSAINNSKDLAQKIKRLLNVCLVSYVGQVSSNANKTYQNRSDTLRRIPDCLKGSQLLAQIHTEEADESQSRMPSFIVANNNSVSGLIVDESPLGKFQGFRRKSEIAKKQLAEDSQVVRFIEDLRSASTSPPPQLERKQHDSNGGFSSDQLMNVIAGQRKSSVSNFTAKSQPQPNTQQSQFHTSNSDLSAPVQQNSIADIEDQKVQKQEKNKQSRISVQIEMMNHVTKQRTLTFNQEEQQDNQQVFSLNVNPTENRNGNNSGRKQNNQTVMMEKIEEKEEYDRRGSGNSENQPKKAAPRELSSSSSDDSDGRGTGNFSQIEMKKKKHKRQTSKRAIEDNPYKDQQDSRKRDKTLEKKASKPTNSLSSSLQSASVMPQTQMQPANFQEIISQTIKEQVTQGFQQILQQVTQLTQQQQYAQQVNSPYSKRSDLRSYAGMQHQGSEEREFASLQSSGSTMTRDYQNEYRELLRRQEFKTNGNGGASSSKKLKMEQPMSKGSNLTLRVNDARVKQNPIKEDYTEDVIDSPNVSDPEDNPRYKRKQSPLTRDNLHTKQSPLRIANLQQSDPVPSQHLIRQQKYSSVQERAPRMSQGNESQHSIPYNQQQHSKTHTKQGQVSSFQQSQHSQQYPGMMSGYYGGNQFFPYPPNYQQFYDPLQPQYFPPQFHPSHINNQVLLHDNDSMFEDFQGGQHLLHQQYHPMIPRPSEISSMLEPTFDSPDSQERQFAIVLENVQSVTTPEQKRGSSAKGIELTQLYEGDHVEVVRLMESAGLAECRFENLTGLFPSSALKLMRRTGGKYNASKFQSSPSREQYKATLQEKKSKLKLNERKKAKGV